MHFVYETKQKADSTMRMISCAIFSFGYALHRQYARLAHNVILLPFARHHLLFLIGSPEKSRVYNNHLVSTTVTRVASGTAITAIILAHLTLTLPIKVTKGAIFNDVAKESSKLKLHSTA